MNKINKILKLYKKLCVPIHRKRGKTMTTTIVTTHSVFFADDLLILFCLKFRKKQMTTIRFFFKKKFIYSINIFECDLCFLIFFFFQSEEKKVTKKEAPNERITHMCKTNVLIFCWKKDKN